MSKDEERSTQQRLSRAAFARSRNAAQRACRFVAGVVVCFALVGRDTTARAWQDAPPGSEKGGTQEAEQPEPHPSAEAAPTQASPAAQATAASEASEPPIDFSEIQPILKDNCFKCHAGENRRGGLRLDDRTEMVLGGDSGKPILGGTLETNELYLRVSSDERTYRMPKNADPLPQGDIDKIRRWVSQGAAWPLPKLKPDSESARFFDPWLVSIGAFYARHEAELAYARPFCIGFILAQLLILVVLRCRAAHLVERSWALGGARRWCAFCARFSSRELLWIWLISVSVLALAFIRGHERSLASRLAALERTVPRPDDRWARTVYGSPPRPIRPDHPKAISMTYYRGNCERNEQLFNGGNYLTATFRVDLCDALRQPARVGDPVSESGWLVRLEIERAPGTADALFSNELMSSVFLSETFFDPSKPAQKIDSPVRLETLEEGKRWVAYFPVKPNSELNVSQGLIYVYTGGSVDRDFRGDPHYGVVYNVAVEDGKLGAESEVWMNSFGNGAFVDPLPPGKLPYQEWFDFRPMPIITGENTKDPKLLGVEEYVRKGLIKPHEPAPAQDGAEKPKSP